MFAATECNFHLNYSENLVTAVAVESGARHIVRAELLGLTIFCTAAAAFLLGITMYIELHDSRADPNQRAIDGSSRVTRPSPR